MTQRVAMQNNLRTFLNVTSMLTNACIYLVYGKGANLRCFTKISDKAIFGTYFLPLLIVLVFVRIGIPQHLHDGTHNIRTMYCEVFRGSVLKLSALVAWVKGDRRSIRYDQVQVKVKT